MTKYAGVPATAISQHEAKRQPGMAALATLFVVTVFIFANMYTTQAILPVFSDDFHVSAPTAGFTVSVLVLAVAIGSLFYGPLSDRVGRKPVMVGASLLLTIPTFLCGIAPNCPFQPTGSADRWTCTTSLISSCRHCEKPGAS